jgi:hypothetical protein
MPNQGLLDENSNTQDPQPTVTPEGTPPQSDNLFVNELAGIKNTDGNQKYDSVPKALDALVHSQSHITTLEESSRQDKQEIEDLKIRLAQHDAVDDVVQRLTSNQPDPVVQETPQPQVVDESAIANAVQQALNIERTVATEESNVSTVIGAITSKYGEKAREIVEAKAIELNTTLEGFKALAARSPELVLALFEAGAPASNSPTTSTINLPATPKPQELQRPEKSLLQGATSEEQASFMAEIKRKVYERNGITE